MPSTYLISGLNGEEGVGTFYENKIKSDKIKSEVDKLDPDALEKVRSGLNSSKSKVDKLDVDKLKPVPVDLKQLSDVLDNNVVKKTVYNELVEKFIMPLILVVLLINRF